MPALRPAAFSIALLGSTLFSFGAIAMEGKSQVTQGTTPVTSGTPDAPQLPLRSRADLDAWLKANAGKPTPFDALSAGSRQRVLTMLGFSESGLGSPPGDELSWELTPPQAVAWLKLFGREDWADRIKFFPVTGRWKGDLHRSSEMDRRLLAFTRDDESTYDKNGFQHQRNVSTLYRRHFPASLIAEADQLPDADLLLLARTSASVAGFTSAEPELGDLMKMLKLLETRGGVDISPLAVQAQHTLMSIDQLDRARALATQYPLVKFDPVPQVTVAADELPTGPKWWRLSADGQSMAAESADLSGTQIFVLAGCHFSVNAAEDIQKDPELSFVFAEHAHWLGEPLGSENLKDWKEWNESFPDTPMHLVTLRREWPMFPSWNMPTYVVVRNGKAIDQTSGSWRNAPEKRGALVGMLRRHGLMPPEGKKTPSPGHPQQTLGD